MSDENLDEKLDSPLIVHKVTDASYQETANNVNLDSTHVEEETATLERHRFKKEKKSSKLPVYLAFAVVIISLVCYLYFSGTLTGENKKESTTEAESTTAAEVNKYENIITVKGNYVFFEGQEVDGLQGLIREIKYLDAGTKFVVQDEDADDTFLSEEILPALSQYNIEYEVKFVISSGLVSKYETTAPASTTASQTSAAAQPEAQ